jgi:hypothetical protein
MTGYTCEKNPLPESACKKISEGGVCTSEPEIAKATRQETTTVSEPTAQTKTIPSLLPTALKLNTAIPGFKAPSDMGLLFATYIIALYKYVISIAVFVATVMFIWGAFRYLVGTSMGNVKRGQEIMKDSIIGLLLLLSATMILRTINPETTTLKTLTIDEIGTSLWQPVENAFNAPAGSKGALKRAAIQKAKATGIQELPCMVKATLDRESGGNIAAINHNEDFNSPAYKVTSRRTYLANGKTYNGVNGTFAPVVCDTNACQVQSNVPKNGDKLDLDSPPNYGLDLQYSHALGAAQAAIFPEYKPCAGKENQGPGHRIGNICLTIPELMSVDGAAAVVVEHNRMNLNTYRNDIAMALGSYVGKLEGGGGHDEAKARKTIFDDCMAKGIDSYPDYSGSSASSGGGGISQGVKVLLIGDSLAVGLTGPLRNLIGADFESIALKGMYTSAFTGGNANLTTQFKEALSKKPNVVLVSLGANDSYAQDPSKQLIATKQAYQTIVNKIKQSGADVYWIGPPPLHPYKGNNNIEPKSQDAVRSIISGADNYFASETLSFKQSDGLHPDSYGDWANAIFAWLTK